MLEYATTRIAVHTLRSAIERIVMGNNVAFLRHKFDVHFKYGAAANVAWVRDNFILTENQVRNASTAVELRDMRGIASTIHAR